jgi:hypothetical protein
MFERATFTQNALCYRENINLSDEVLCEFFDKKATKAFLCRSSERIGRIVIRLWSAIKSIALTSCNIYSWSLAYICGPSALAPVRSTSCNTEPANIFSCKGVTHVRSVI